jgi:Protein of unknown function DUF262
MHSFAGIEEGFPHHHKELRLTNGTDEAINTRYTSGEGRILIETNRERLQVFVESLRTPGYLDLAPFYQRRERWDDARKSLLIESFIMNIPVPPVFLYEREFNQYEVMDGQQRISAIRDFYDDKFELTGLEYWPELEGRRYSTLPDKIRAGIDRRSLSSIVLLKESAVDDIEVSLIRRVVFDRLNRGGVRLERQEIRNALFPSEFNEMIHKVAENPIFRQAWKIPDDRASALRSIFFQKMGDLEVVLRFFALRHAEKLEGPLQQFLDEYLSTMKNASSVEVDFLHNLFVQTLELGHAIYGEHLFRTWDPDKACWSTQPNKGFSDCVLTGLAWNLHKSRRLIDRRNDVISGTTGLFETHDPATFTGRKSTKKDLLERLKLFRDMLAGI